MLGTDVAVGLALLLSLGSAVLCVAYGWSHWNADDVVPSTRGGSTTIETSEGSAAGGTES